MSLAIDIAEPESIINLLQQISEVDVMSLNLNGYPDYFWLSADNTVIGIEREPLSAILGNMVQIEDEIRRHLPEEGCMILLAEGTVLSHPDGTTVFEILGTHLKTAFFSRTSYHTLMAWLWQVQVHGINLICTPSWKETALAIASIYNNSQKAEHHTFKRHFKPIVSWQPNPHIQSLMGIPSAGLGEKRASDLIAHFPTLHAAVTADREELAKVLGQANTTKFLKAIGR